jgi:hypothetical protein
MNRTALFSIGSFALGAVVSALATNSLLVGQIYSQFTQNLVAENQVHTALYELVETGENKRAMDILSHLVENGKSTIEAGVHVIEADPLSSLVYGQTMQGPKAYLAGSEQ